MGQLLEDIMLGMFVGGLFPDIRARVRAMRPTDLEEAQQFAQLKEDVSCNPRRTYEGEDRTKSHGEASRGQGDKGTAYGKQKVAPPEIPFKRLTDKEVAKKRLGMSVFDATRSLTQVINENKANSTELSSFLMLRVPALEKRQRRGRVILRNNLSSLCTL